MAKKKKKLTALAKLKMQLEWYENFAQYIENNFSGVYNEACSYADNIEAGVEED